ncbi:MAG: hypothetical protein HY805_08060 [Nitrospirae bacterium]|nr:hypothetical protein [Nitrospirota bacterium]
MNERKRLKRALVAGAIGGASLSIAVSLLLDVLYADVLGGTWQDAISRDLRTFIGVTASSESAAVALIFVFILIFLGIVGALMGAIFAFFLYRFFSSLSEQQ